MSIQDVLRKHEDDLMSRPNVVLVGIGKRGKKEVIIVHVTHKVPASQLQSHEIIPKSVEGYEVDVEESGNVMAQPD